MGDKKEAVAAKCGVCTQAAARYTCPRCSQRTCSAACVAAHKEATGCSGKRDRTAFVGRSEFDERAFLSDYRFLEELQRADDVAKRSRPPAPKAELCSTLNTMLQPAHLKSLVYQAGRRGVQLHILPPGMEKRRANTSRYDGRSQTLSWHLEWSFPAAGCKASNTRVVERRCLGEVLATHLTLKPEEGLVHEGLREHIDAGVEGLTVLLRRERSPANAVEYHLIDTSQTVQQALTGKVVVEYPTFLVLLPREAGQYRLVGGAHTPVAAAAAAAAADAQGRREQVQQISQAQPAVAPGEGPGQQQSQQMQQEQQPRASGGSADRAAPHQPDGSSPQAAGRVQHVQQLEGHG